MNEFSFTTRIFFGEGALERLRRVKNKRVLIVTDHFMAQSGVADRVASYLDHCMVTIFSDVVPDPPIENVAAGVNVFQACKPQVVVALGGGSAIDAAKAIRSMATQILGDELEVEECFAIPTTSGTGTEVTEFTVITDRNTNRKYALAAQSLRPPTAILDPALVVTAPPSVTADSGMDVLTHALEAYVATGASDFTDALAEKAISLVFRWLPEAYADGTNLLAREKMHNASCMAGLAFNSAGLGFCHGISHALGGQLHIPHGRSNAMILPHIVEFNANIAGTERNKRTLAAKKYQRIAHILDLPCASTPIGVSQLVNAIKALNKALNIPTTLREMGCDMQVYENNLLSMAEAALEDTTAVNNPRKPNAEDIIRLMNAVAGR